MRSNCQARTAGLPVFLADSAKRKALSRFEDHGEESDDIGSMLVPFKVGFKLDCNFGELPFAYLQI